MSRSDQYIGLTREAERFIEHKGLVSLPDVQGEAYGAFDINHLRVWIDKPTGIIYSETVQVAPWSSGPMFFTVINGPDGVIGSWVEDESVKPDQFDYVTGRYWV
jgi:hypothetical protein